MQFFFFLGLSTSDGEWFCFFPSVLYQIDLFQRCWHKHWIVLSLEIRRGTIEVKCRLFLLFFFSCGVNVKEKTLRYDSLKMYVACGGFNAQLFPRAGSRKTTWSVTFVSSHSNHSGIPLSSHFHNHLRHGTNKTSSILPPFYLLSGVMGCSGPVRRGKALPNHSLSSQRPPLALVMGGRNVMTGHFKGDSVQGHVTLSLTTL